MKKNCVFGELPGHFAFPKLVGGLSISKSDHNLVRLEMYFR